MTISTLTKKLGVLAVLATAGALHAAPAADANHARYHGDGARQWNIGPMKDTWAEAYSPSRTWHEQVEQGWPHRLHNSHSFERLGYRIRRHGINLGMYGSDEGFPGHEFSFYVPGGRSYDTIHLSERVAIYNDIAGKFVKYGYRSCRCINLQWSETPVYEWSIRRSIPYGKWRSSPVPTHGNHAIYNHTNAKYLIWAWRSEGVNLGWTRSISSNAADR